jgi:thermitase
MKGKIVWAVIVMMVLGLLIFPSDMQITRTADLSRSREQEPVIISEPAENLFLQSPEDIRKLDFDNDSNVEFVLGVNASESQVEKLKGKISKFGGDTENSIRAGNDIKAVTVKVPVEKSQAFLDQISSDALVTYMEPDFRVEVTAFVPNDPDWPLQWGPKKIQADYAWSTTTGSPDILVAIVDTGIDYTHPELAANYVPLGYNWVSNNSYVMDDHGHGTHCAGIVAARINNGIGIAGLAQVQIMAEKVLDSSGSGYGSWVAAGIYHATDAGAKIISMSLGGGGESTLMHDALEYAQSRGVLIVAAAGNNHSDYPFYPAYYEECIAVSATDSSDNPAWFSNYGDWIDVAAPGVNIQSTIPGERYASWNGTSMACPHVAGTAALVWSLAPGLSSSFIRYIIESTTDDLGDPGFDEIFGHGRINAKKAVSAIPEHDLLISEWEYPHRIPPGKEVIFNATISNFARNDESYISVKFLVDGTVKNSQGLSSLMAGTSFVLSFAYDTTNPGFHNFTCSVIPVYGENSIINNVATSIVSVRSAGILRVPIEYPKVRLALNNATYGDTVLVSGGVYAEGQLDMDEDGVALVAVTNTILDGQKNAYVLNVKANRVTVSGFELRQAKTGAYLNGANNTFTNNLIHDCDDGILLRKSWDSTISFTSATVTPSSDYLTIRYCLKIDNAFNNNISQNTFMGGALWLHYSNSNSITGNQVLYGNFGILIEVSMDNLLRENTVMGNTRNLAVWKGDLKYPWQVINDIDESNTVDGKPIYYWVNAHDRTVPPNAGCIVLVYCTNISIVSQDIRNNLNGILLLDTNNTIIRANSIEMNQEFFGDFLSGGIVAILGSSNNLVTSNALTDNKWGIYIEGGTGNNVSRNKVTCPFNGMMINSQNCIIAWNNVTTSEGNMAIEIAGEDNILMFNRVVCATSHGVLAEGVNQTITGNIITSDIWNLYLWTLNCSVITCNDLITLGNDAPIVTTYGCFNNLMIHNNIRGSKAPICYDLYNAWDDGYPSGGNYWGSYVGTDERNGFDQSGVGSDGIGDEPYNITLWNRDHYPLMKPYPWSSHDIGITSLKASKNIVGQGYDMSVRVMIFNYGNSTQTFNVTARINTTVIGLATYVILAGRTFTSITLAWHTNNWTKGNYTISAYAWSVPDETDTTDNSRTGETVQLTLAGDVNGDKKVDGLDIAVLAKYFGKPSTAFPNADINDDGKIDGKEIAIASKYFNTQYQ